MLKKVICSLIMMVSISGCAFQAGPGKGDLSISDSSQNSLEESFKIGEATSRDVLLKLGPPTKKSNDAGYEVWSYIYRKQAAVAVLFVAVPVGLQKTAVFYFRESDGVLEKITYKKESQ